MSAIPAVNGLVEIIVGDARLYRSRMEDVGDGCTSAEPGTALELAWIDDGARFVVPVQLAGFSRDNTAQWHVEVRGEPRQDNRRLYVRGGGGERVQLEPPAGVLDPKLHIAGEVVDVSEAGVRCRVPRCEFRPGDPAHVSIKLRDLCIDATGNVLTLRAPAGLDATDIVVTYDLGETVAQAVRRYVFERQLAERRARQDVA